MSSLVVAGGGFAVWRLARLVSQVCFALILRVDQGLTRGVCRSSIRERDRDRVEAADLAARTDVDEARRQERIKIAQRKRNNGDTTREIADDVGMSHTWVIENTEPPEAEA